MKNEKISPNETVRLAEYREAGELCRANETLARTTYQIYLALLTVLAGYIIKEHSNIKEHPDLFPWGNLLLALAGFLMSVFFAASIHRMKCYYRVFMERIRELECKLGMELYTRGYKVWKNQCISLGDKGAFVLLAGLYAIAFLLYCLYLLFASWCNKL